MSQPKSNKVHTNIGHPRSLCGLTPIRGEYKIVSYASFFSAAPEDQCGSCLGKLKARGYNIERERAKYRTIYGYAQALVLIP